MGLDDERAQQLVEKANNREILTAAFNVLCADLFEDTQKHDEDLGVFGIRIASLYNSMNGVLASSEDPLEKRLNNRIAFRRLIMDFIDLLFLAVSEQDNVGPSPEIERTRSRRFKSARAGVV